MPANKKKQDKKADTPPSSDDEPEEQSDSGSSEPAAAPKKKNLFAMMMDSDEDESEEEESEEEEPPPPPKKPDKTDKAAKPDKSDKPDKPDKAEKAEKADKDSSPEKKKKKEEPVDNELAMFGEKKKKKKSAEKEEKDGKEEKKDKKEKKEKKEGKEKKKRSPTVCEVVEVSPVPKKDKLKLCKVVVAPGIDPIEIVTSAPNIIANKKYIAAPPGYTTANGTKVEVSKVGGIESAGMFCGPKEMGWDTDVLDPNQAVMLADSAEAGQPAPSYEEAVEAFREREREEIKKREEAEKAAAAAKAAAAKDDKKGGKKDKKKAQKAADDEDFDAALDEFQEEKPEPKAKAKSAADKKKAQKKAADEDFDAALDEFQEEKPEPKAKAKSAADKKKAQKKAAEEDFDAALDEFQEEKPEPKAKAKSAADKKKAQKKAAEEDFDAALDEFQEEKPEPKAKAKSAADKKKAQKQAADEDFDAALDEIQEGKPDESATGSAPEPKAKAEAKSASQKKKDKKKGHKGDADDDLDAALEESLPDKPADATAEQAPKETQEAAEPAQGDNKEEEELDAKTLANRKKKEKKAKAKAKQKTGGEGMWASADAEEETKDEEPKKEDKKEEEKKDSKKEKPGKGGGKKESAVVRAARERLEMEQRLQEEKRAFEEAERKRVEEEKRAIEEEERRQEEERQKRRDAKAAKIAKQKAEGTYLTKAQKLKAQRAAQLREQFGFTMDKDEDEDAEKGEKVEKEDKQKRPMATKLKKKKLAPGEEGSPEKVKEEEPGDKEEKEEVKPEKKPDKKEDAKPVAQEEEEESDGWEKLDEKEEEKDEAAKEDEEAEASEDGSDDESSSSSSSSSSFMGYRSPVICIMGHVDTGKTKLLDKIRRTNVQEGEAGGITQQIGATFFPDIALQEQTKKVDEDFELEVPGLLIIDTPGHESFNNLRMRGSSLADLAILVIDIMHGLEPQTVESLELLKKRRCPFIIALNKIDILYQWNAKTYTSVQEALDRQEQSVRMEFQTRYNNVMLQLNERGLNCSLYWENDDPRTSVSIVPTSALTGEGVPDLLYMILKLTQDLMGSKLECREELECTVIEVKNIEGLGTTVDVVLLNGTLREGDTIVLAGLSGPIVTTIRALLTPQPMKEMRVKNEYVKHAEISTSMGVKISAPGLEEAVAGTQLLICGPDDDLEELKDEASEGFESILNDFAKEPAGVYVKASTLGSLEALLSFLQDMKIPVFDVGIGEVHKKDVKKAMIMKEKKHPEYALILAFDVKVNSDAQKQADTDGVTIFTADIIYHLQDKFTKYMEKFRESQKTETRKVAVFPVVLQIDKQHIFRKQDPIIVGCQVVGGQLRAGTPLCVPDKDNLAIGHVAGIEINKKSVPMARRGDTVCVKIEQTTAQNHIMYGRHFDHTSQLYSKISRESIDTLKEHFKDEMKKEDWELVIGMKKVFQIQ